MSLFAHGDETDNDSSYAFNKGKEAGIKQERERIWAWGHLMCDTHEHTNIPLPKEMGGGEVKKNNRRRRRCVECWNTLLN